VTALTSSVLLRIDLQCIEDTETEGGLEKKTARELGRRSFSGGLGEDGGAVGAA